jgi:thiol-disulfide isomerase/thioredoxin
MTARVLLLALLLPFSTACATEQRTPLLEGTGTPSDGTGPTGGTGTDVVADVPGDVPGDAPGAEDVPGDGSVAAADGSTVDVAADGSAVADVAVPIDVVLPTDGSTQIADGSGAPANPNQVAGSPRPTWQLVDFQPVSPRTGTTYGLEAFDGTVTVVALHSSWCGYCRSQAEKMEQLYYELDGRGVRVQMASINSSDESAITNQANLAGVCTFPLFQDTADAGVWTSIGGTKDDFYIYRADGTLALYINHRETPTNLSVEEDYNRFRDLLIAIAEGRQ